MAFNDSHYSPANSSDYIYWQSLTDNNNNATSGMSYDPMSHQWSRPMHEHPRAVDAPQSRHDTFRHPSQVSFTGTTASTAYSAAASMMLHQSTVPPAPARSAFPPQGYGTHRSQRASDQSGGMSWTPAVSGYSVSTSQHPRYPSDQQQTAAYHPPTNINPAPAQYGIPPRHPQAVSMRPEHISASQAGSFAAPAAGAYLPDSYASLAQQDLRRKRRNRHNGPEPSSAGPVRSSGERVPCQWVHCGIPLDDVTPGGLKRHLRDAHFANELRSDKQRERCMWVEGGAVCGEEMDQASLGKHISAVHLQALMRWCERCGHSYARPDSLARHNCHGRA